MHASLVRVFRVFLKVSSLYPILRFLLLHFQWSLWCQIITKTKDYQWRSKVCIICGEVKFIILVHMAGMSSVLLPKVWSPEVFANIIFMDKVSKFNCSLSVTMCWLTGSAHTFTAGKHSVCNVKYEKSIFMDNHHDEIVW